MEEQFWAAIGGMTYAELVDEVGSRLRDIYSTGEYDLADPKDWAELLNYARIAREDTDE